MKRDNGTGDLFEGRRLRDKGIEKVTNHAASNFERCSSSARYFVKHVAPETFTGEDIRFYCEQCLGKTIMHHPNAWGALINSLVKANLIYKTGQHRQMTDKISHARETPVYRRML